jgi:hypothetical protein
MPSHVRTLCLTALLLALPAVAQQPAASPSYNIELVIFRAASAAGAAENWSTQAVARGASGEDTASTGTQTGRFVSALPADKFQLGSVASKLRSTGAYVPVAHVGWTQSASAWGTRAGFPLHRLGIDVDGLSGMVSLERGQYLHLGLSLTYAMPNPPAGVGAAPGTAFTLNESRRVKFYERNYYDHPAFGVIALVTPAQGARAAGR